MGAAISRMALTIEGLLLMAIGMVGLAATGEDGGQAALLPSSPLTNTGLLVIGLAVLGAAQSPGPRRIVAWVQAVVITSRLVAAARGEPLEAPWHAGPSALVGTLLIAVALLSLSGPGADSPPAGPGRRR